MSAPAIQRSFGSALITGVAGSGGSYLAEYVLEHAPDVELHGLARWHSTTGASNLAGADGLTVHECDLTDLSSVVRVLQATRPEAIFHLASHANVRSSFDTPLGVVQNNVMGTANLLEAIRLCPDYDPVVQLCSTSEVYGQVFPDEVPITEDQPLRPSSPYAVSKVTQDLLGFSYFRSYGMQVIRTRMFAYVNPRRGDLFATTFARQVARIEAGLQSELRHGNLESVRTLIDVRDAMESYWLAARHCEAGEAYNIGGTTTVSVGEFLELLRKHATKPIPTRQDPALLRPADVTLQIPAVEKFERATTWQPRYTFEETVQSLLDDARARVAREVAAGS